MRAAALLVVGLITACSPRPEPPAVPPRADAQRPRPAPVLDTQALRVCADPNNLPFSNEHGEGFENAVARIIASDLGRTVAYTWWPQRRGFVRNTLDAERCDVIVGVPEHFELALTTRPYYRSHYVFVTQPDARVPASLDDPWLRTARLGVHVVGDDLAGVPPAMALAARGIVSNIHGYSLFGDYSRPNPPADLIDGVRRGDIDVALAWGPLAGYFAARARPALRVTPIPPVPGLSMSFSMSMAVRQGATALQATLDDVLRRRAGEIRQVLADFHIPVLEDDRDLPTTSR